MIPGTECGQQLKKAQDTFYWVNPYDILQECYVQSKDKGREAGRLSQANLSEPASWKSAMLGHTVPCADRRHVHVHNRSFFQCHIL